MGNERNRLSIHPLEQFVKRSNESVWQAAAELIKPTLLRWWENPLLGHARLEKPLPWVLVGRWLGISMALLSGLSIAAWVLNLRSLGAVLIGASLGVVLAVTVPAPALSAGWVTRQMRSAKQDPRRRIDVNPPEVVWGLALASLWRLRWLIVAGLAVTPTLIIGLLRMDVASFTAWQSSVQALGASTPASSVGWLPPDGHIPYLRLLMRAMSAGLLPWVMLPLLAQLGITSALALRDASLSPLIGLLGGLLLGGLLVSGWEALARTPLLAGSLEVVRLFLLIGLLVGINAAALWINRWNGKILRVSA